MLKIFRINGSRSLLKKKTYLWRNADKKIQVQKSEIYRNSMITIKLHQLVN